MLSLFNVKGCPVIVKNSHLPMGDFISFDNFKAAAIKKAVKEVDARAFSRPLVFESLLALAKPTDDLDKERDGIYSFERNKKIAVVKNGELFIVTSSGMDSESILFKIGGVLEEFDLYDEDEDVEAYCKKDQECLLPFFSDSATFGLLDVKAYKNALKEAAEEAVDCTALYEIEKSRIEALNRKQLQEFLSEKEPAVILPNGRIKSAGSIGAWFFSPCRTKVIRLSGKERVECDENGENFHLPSLKRGGWENWEEYKV